MNHKRIAGFVGLRFRLIIRINFLEPYYKVVPLDCYKFLVTNHGIIMIFFFLMPILIGGFGNYLLPLLGGLSDLNLPLFRMCMGAGIDRKGIDFLMFSLHLAGVSRIFSSIKFICTLYTIFSNNISARSSIVLWAYLFTSMLLLITLPVLAAAITMLLFDRKFSSAFFDPLGGGDPVYVLILPGFGIIRHICLNLSLIPDAFGFYGLLFAMFSIVWHHMFTVGLDVKTAVFFRSVTMIIGVPTGIKVFTWLYIFGGVTGIILSACSYISIIIILLQCQCIISNIGFNLCFFPMHYFGLCGLPRRVCIYEISYNWINMICTIGSFITAFKSLVKEKKIIGYFGSSAFYWHIVNYRHVYKGAVYDLVI
ncbi:unnamed protein product [Hymenolepis diminuta]|uniref:Cytochrome c oxidase subunit 1 n=1 Tax=Hymenolepis diminuta TaxID=6216 RepID=A0A3P6ZBQ0_HYMDI|nr:unnamed protein product [Hymenolepis diminuta]